MPLEHILQLQAALMNLSMSCYPDNLDNVDSILLLCANTLEKYRDSGQYVGGCVKLGRVG